MTGGFISSDPQSKEPYVPQIIVCQNQIKDSITFQTTIAHELVSALASRHHKYCGLY